jgi:hypothetical protein
LPLLDDPQLGSLGWDTWFEERFPPDVDGGAPARVVADHGAEFVVRDGIESLPQVEADRGCEQSEGFPLPPRGRGLG